MQTRRTVCLIQICFMSIRAHTRHHACNDQRAHRIFRRWNCLTATTDFSSTNSGQSQPDHLQLSILLGVGSGCGVSLACTLAQDTTYPPVCMCNLLCARWCHIRLNSDTLAAIRRCATSFSSCHSQPSAATLIS